MSSNTHMTESKRLRKVRASGKARKRAERKGTTPKFPIHKETAAGKTGKA